MEARKAVLLMAYGTPSTLDDVEPYYTHIRHGRKPSQEEVENLKERYSLVGGRTPLYEITESTARKLGRALEAERIQVYAGMKHWHPYISEVLPRIISDGNTELLSIALAPHYSKMSIGPYEEAVREANRSNGEKLRLDFVESWYLDEKLIEEWCKRIRKASSRFASLGEVFYLFTAHSLPERILAWNDPYRDQLLESSEEIARRLELKSTRFGFGFQSAGHTSEPWLGPDILEKLRELAAQSIKSVLVVPIGFVSDHLEILYDIDIEAKQLAGTLGLELARTESFNDSDEFVDVLKSVVKESGFA